MQLRAGVSWCLCTVWFHFLRTDAERQANGLRIRALYKRVRGDLPALWDMGASCYKTIVANLSVIHNGGPHANEAIVTNFATM